MRGPRRCTITTHDFPFVGYLQENTAAVLGKVEVIPNTLIPQCFVFGDCVYATLEGLGEAGFSWDVNDRLVCFSVLPTYPSVVLDRDVFKPMILLNIKKTNSLHLTLTPLDSLILILSCWCLFSLTLRDSGSVTVVGSLVIFVLLVSWGCGTCWGWEV